MRTLGRLFTIAIFAIIVAACTANFGIPGIYNPKAAPAPNNSAPQQSNSAPNMTAPASSNPASVTQSCVDVNVAKEILNRNHAIDGNNPGPAIAEFDVLRSKADAAGSPIGIDFSRMPLPYVINNLGSSGSVLVYTNLNHANVTFNGAASGDKWIPIFAQGLQWGFFLADDKVSVPTPGSIVYICTLLKPSDLAWWH